MHRSAGQPGQHAADHGDGHDGQEDRAGAYRLLRPDGCSPARSYRAQRPEHGISHPSAHAQPALGVPVERRPAHLARRRHAVAHHHARRWCPTVRRARSPTGAAAAVRSAAAARRPGIVGVGSIRTPGASPSNSTVSSTTASPWMVAASPGGSQYAAPTMTVPGLVADQRNPLRCTGNAPGVAPPRPVRTWATSTSSRRCAAAGSARRPGRPPCRRRSPGELRAAAASIVAAALGVAGDVPDRQIGQRAGHAVSAEAQHHEVIAVSGRPTRLLAQRAGVRSDRVCHRLDTVSMR